MRAEPGAACRRGAGEAVAMAHRARPHTTGAATGAAPARRPASAHSFLRSGKPESPCPAARSRRTPIREPTHPPAWGLGRSGGPGMGEGRCGTPEEAPAG